MARCFGSEALKLCEAKARCFGKPSLDPLRSLAPKHCEAKTCGFAKPIFDALQVQARCFARRASRICEAKARC